jgi:hypothetical protein
MANFLNTSTCELCGKDFLAAYPGQTVCRAKCRSENKQPKRRPRVDRQRFSTGSLRCEVPECPRRACHDHHVVDEQVVRRWKGDISDRRNSFRICFEHHEPHTNHFRKLKTEWLRDETVEFAFELMGDFAADWLRRMYDDSAPDIRIERCLKKR